MRTLMITLPLLMIAALAGFFGLIAAVAGTGRKARGAHRA
jgi:hypothetical protein